jgi:GNAT superfamily N-acetyltransferase
MASTKERQKLGKVNRQIKELNETTSTIMSKVYPSIQMITPKCSFRLAGLKQLNVMFNEFVAEYVAAGDSFRASATSDNSHFFDEPDSDRTTYILHYEGKDAGFITLRFEGTDNPVLIEVVYIRPEFRGLNLASMFYLWAVNEKGAQDIELSFRRVRDNIAYWRAIGFTKFQIIPSQVGTLTALVILSNTKGTELAPFSLKYAREYLNTHNLKSREFA